MTLTATVTIDNKAGATAEEQADILRMINVALEKWGAVLAGSANLNIAVEINNDSGTARAGPGSVRTVARFENGIVVAEGAAGFELRSGTNPNGTDVDIGILLPIGGIRNELWFDPTPATSNDIPRDKTDAISVFVHEIGHGLGFTGYGEALSGNYRSPYDTRVIIVDGKPFFSGPNTVALLGTTAPLTPGNYAHYGTSNAVPGNDPLTGLMNGVVYYRGYRYEIGNLDLAIMADIGLGTVRNDIFDQTWMSDLDGGLGIDLFKGDYSARSDGIRLIVDINGDTFITGASGASNNAHLRNIENLQIKAGSGADSLSAGAGDDSLEGGAGNDTLSGGAGNDSTFGGAGDDKISDTSGSNYLRGDDGHDEIIGGPGFDDINGNIGNDTAYGGLGDDWVVGGKDNDLLYGEAGFDIVYGNLGNDTLYGGDGNDWVRGGQGDDVIEGGAGNDYMSGDRGNDTISGGSGADSFYFFAGANLDRVTDFNRSEGDFVRLEPGTTYTVAQSGSDTVITVTDGQMVLVGVQLSSLTGDWLMIY